MKSRSSSARVLAVAGWMAGLLACVFIIGRSQFSTDMSAFLPARPTAEQQVLIGQLQDGMVSRLILAGIEGSDAATRAALSREMAGRLRKSELFASVSNGETVNAERDREFLFTHRYLLSPAVSPERFTSDGLHHAIADTIDMLASPAGLLVKPLLPRDPTAEIMQLVDQLEGGAQPRLQHGAWISRDGRRALLLIQTRAAGTDIDGQQQAIALVRQIFADAVSQHGGNAAQARLLLTGPGVFAVQSRDTIKEEVSRLMLASTAMIVVLLLLAYRSVLALVLGLVPILSGALAGVAAVSLGFGVVHGITLGFGSALIGEAVDYAIYLFIQSRQSANEEASRNWIRNSWPTIRLGVLTSVAGFATLLLSDFPGLAQLGLYAITGLIVAALVTRFVLPQLMPHDFTVRDVSAFGQRLLFLQRRAAILRWPLIMLAVGAAAIVWQHRAALWNAELSSLSPVPAAGQALDASLRADLGAPDVRYMVVVPGADAEAVLRSSEQVSASLQQLVKEGHLAGFQSPAQWLPSIAMQEARRASLPVQDLELRLQRAIAGLPVRAELFAPFMADVSAASASGALRRPDLDGTSLALLVDSLMFERNGRWTAVLPLRAPDGDGVIDGNAVRAALRKAGQSNALFVDLKSETNRLYAGYLNEAVALSAAGLACIMLLLLLASRSLPGMVRVMMPPLAAALVVVASLVLAGERLIILHLIGLLLVFAVGSNYALFFNRRGARKDLSGSNEPQTLVSIGFANLTTVIGFGLLGFSNVPVLQAIGIAVGPGTLLTLVFSAAFASREPARER